MLKTNLTAICRSSQRNRKKESTPLTEAVLMERFANLLTKRSTSRSAIARIVLEELDGLQGRPDLVEIKFQALPSTISLDVLAKSLRSPTKARILSLLRYGAPRRRAFLENSTGFNRQALTRHLEELAKSGLVELHENSTVSLCCPLPWGMTNIVTYEVKLANWRRALQQAFVYRSFSHSVRVVMPSFGAARAKKLRQFFRANGIGLIAVEANGNTRIVIRSRKLRPASRRLYLMAVGAGLSKFLEERRRLHRRIRPESIQSI